MNDKISRSPSYKWWVVFMLWFICFFNYADRQAISSVFAALQKEFNFTATQLGYIGSAFGYVYGACAILAGYVGDRVARRHLILGGCLFWSFVTVGTAWCGKAWQFITVRALEGLGETFYFPASMSLVSDYHSRQTRSRAMSFHQSSVYAGTVLGSWVAALLAQHYNWRYGFYLFGGAGFVLAIILYRYLVEPPRGASEQAIVVEQEPVSFWGAVGDVVRRPTAWVLMVTFVLANFVATIFLTWTPKFLMDKFDFKMSTAGLSGAAFIHLASAFAVPLAGTLADKLAQKFVGGRILAQSGGLLLGATFVFFVGSTTSVAVLLTSMVLFGLCKGCYDAGIFASLYDVVPPRSRATAAGMMNTVGWGLGSFGPLLTGWYTDHGPHGSKLENMSHFIAYSASAYIIGGALLLVGGLFLVRRDYGGKSSRGKPTAH
jgi:MFS family permease